jgi:hypothetical protein
VFVNDGKSSQCSAITLTLNEFKTLAYFIKHSKRAISWDELGIPTKLNAHSEGKPNSFRDDSRTPSERSDAGTSIVQEVFGFVKSKLSEAERRRRAASDDRGPGKRTARPVPASHGASGARLVLPTSTITSGLQTIQSIRGQNCVSRCKPIYRSLTVSAAVRDILRTPAARSNGRRARLEPAASCSKWGIADTSISSAESYAHSPIVDSVGYRGSVAVMSRNFSNAESVGTDDCLLGRFDVGF